MTEDQPTPKFLLDYSFLKSIMEGDISSLRILGELKDRKERGENVTVLTTSLQLIAAINHARPRLHMPEHACPHCGKNILRQVMSATGLEGVHLIMREIPVTEFSEYPVAVIRPIPYVSEKACQSEILKIREVFGEEEHASQNDGA